MSQIFRKPLQVLVLALAVLAAGPSVAQDRFPITAVTAFVESLSSSEAAAALIPFDDPERLRWRYTPGWRGGLPLSGMDTETRAAAFATLRSITSDHGMAVVSEILRREGILGQIEGNPDYRDPGKYYLAVFGMPEAGRWGLRFEGHHLSINVTFAGERIASVMPLSLASNPERIPASGETLLTVHYDEADRQSQAVEPDLSTLLGGLLSVFTPEAAATDLADLRARLVTGAAQRTSRAYRFTGNGVDLTMEIAGANHRHITLSNAARNFGGS